MSIRTWHIMLLIAMSPLIATAWPSWSFADASEALNIVSVSRTADQAGVAKRQAMMTASDKNAKALVVFIYYFLCSTLNHNWKPLPKKSHRESCTVGNPKAVSALIRGGYVSSNSMRFQIRW